MKRLYVLVLLAALPALTLAAAPNPFAQQCDHLAHLTTESPLFSHFAPGQFWQDRQMAEIYVGALHEKRATARPGRAPSDRVEDRAALMLAAIVRGDLDMLKATNSPGVESYFRDTGITVLTMAASCNFAQGVDYLLAQREDPNRGSDVGSFNVALLYGNNAMAERLLRHGYRIGADTKRCESSKYIVANSREIIDGALRARVTATSCPVGPTATPRPGSSQ